MKKPLDILLIEDDLDDVDLLKEALEDNNIKYHLAIIREGDKVFNHLAQIETLPEIIVMDLNLPKTSGKEILFEIKKLASFTQIPIIILTTSSAKEDIDYCNNLGIRKYLTKPVSVEGWNTTIQSIITVANHSEV